MANVSSTKERSALYPIITLEECFSLIETVSKISGKLVSTAKIAETIGMSSKTNSFRSKISTCKQFGLLKSVGGAGTLQLTDLARRYIYPTNDQERKDIAKQAFLTSPLYAKLVEKYVNSAVPPVDRLSNILLQDYRITQSAKDTAAEQFIASAEQIGILQNGVLILEDDDSTVSANNPPQPASSDSAVNQGVEPSASADFENRSSFSSSEVYRFEIPTLSGAVAQIVIPVEVTLKDLDFLEKYIQLMLTDFLSNLKAEKSG